MKTNFSVTGNRRLQVGCPGKSRWCLFPAFLLLALAPSLLRAEIPEPPTVFYGQVINRTSGQLYLLTNGTLTWKIVPAAGGSPVVLTVALQAASGGALSYRLSIPHHALAPGATVPVGVVPLTVDGADYQHVEITVDGWPAKILGENGDPFRLAQAARATAYRLDLELFNPLPDSDGDGLPDWWEERYGLDRFFAGDAALDHDNDGATNLQEFNNGTDPTIANTSPVLSTERVAVIEGGTTGLRLQVADSDSRPADLRYTILSSPVGGALCLRNSSPPIEGQPGSDRPLMANATFTQADVDAGRVIFRQLDAAAQSTSLQLKVNDENPEHLAATGTVAVVVSSLSAADPGKLSLWLDANRAAALEGSTWSDISGNHLDALAPASFPPIFETDSPGGNRSLRLNGGCWALSVSDETAAFPASERSLFAVFRADGSGRQQVLGGTRFELGIMPTDDPTRPGQLRYATESAALYSPGPVPKQWLLAAIWEQNAQTHMELNGLWAAGPNPCPESTMLANKSGIGGKLVGQYNPATQSWDFQPTDLLDGEVAEILVFKRALSSAERQRINYHLLSKWLGYVIWDASAEARPVTLTVPSAGLTALSYSNYVAAHGPDRRNILLGGAGADELRGGMEPDILVGGPGNDRLAGGGGRDLFVIRAGDGNDTILDFNTVEGDIIDLSDLLSGSSRNLADYVQLSTVGTNSWLRINTSGAGNGFTNAEITLVNNVLRQSDLDSLWGNGNLVARGIRVEGTPWINVVATRPAASEEGPAAGEFSLSRSGSLENALTVNLSIGGSAVNGVDYSFLPSTATFAPGQSSLRVLVQPYEDSLVEVQEVVELAVLEGSGYNVGTSSRAQVTIADLPQRITIEAIEPLASRSGVPGYFLLSRSGLLERSMTVRLQIGGTAVNGVDYQYVPAVLLLNSGQASVLIPVLPIATPPLAGGPKSVDIRVLSDPNSAYLLGTTSTARVWLVDELLTLGIWRARSFPGDTTDLLFLAGQDPDQDGFVNLVEYALGLSPTKPDGVEARALLPRARIRDGRLAVEFKKQPAATDLEYIVEVSGDLTTWQSGSLFVEEIGVPEFAGQPEMVCFRDRTPCNASSHRYIRVRVKLVP